jgi:hypothetical protein
MLKKNSWKLITICWFKMMFIKICYQKQITVWGGGAMVRDLTPQCGGEKFKSPHCNLGYLSLIWNKIISFDIRKIRGNQK